MSKHFTLTLIGAILAAFVLVGAGIHSLSAQDTAARTTSSRPALPRAEEGHYQLQSIERDALPAGHGDRPGMGSTLRQWLPARTQISPPMAAKPFRSRCKQTVWEEDRLDWANGSLIVEAIAMVQRAICQRTAQIMKPRLGSSKWRGDTRQSTGLYCDCVFWTPGSLTAWRSRPVAGGRHAGTGRIAETAGRARRLRPAPARGRAADPPYPRRTDAHRVPPV